MTTDSERPRGAAQQPPPKAETSDLELLGKIRAVVPEDWQADDEHAVDAEILGRVHALLYG